MDWISNPEIWSALAALTLLELLNSRRRSQPVKLHEPYLERQNLA